MRWDEVRTTWNTPDPRLDPTPAASPCTIVHWNQRQIGFPSFHYCIEAEKESRQGRLHFNYMPCFVPLYNYTNTDDKKRRSHFILYFLLFYVSKAPHVKSDWIKHKSLTKLENKLILFFFHWIKSVYRASCFIITSNLFICWTSYILILQFSQRNLWLSWCHLRSSVVRDQIVISRQCQMSFKRLKVAISSK